MIRIELPFHLRNLAGVEREIEVAVDAPITLGSVLDAIEKKYPMLRGTIREHGTLKRRPFLRYYACSADLSLDPPDTPLPDAIVQGKEPFIVLGSIAGG